MICKYGGEPIEGSHYVVFHALDENGRTVPESFACQEHHLEHQIAEYVRSGVLTTSLCHQAVLDRLDMEKAREIIRKVVRGPDAEALLKPLWFDHFCNALDLLGEMVRQWQWEVWFGCGDPSNDDTLTEPWKYDPDIRRYKEGVLGVPDSLQAITRSADVHGMSAVVDGNKYLLYDIAGRTTFQIERKHGTAFVTIVVDTDSPHARGGINAIGATFEEAAALLSQAMIDWNEGKIEFKTDEDVCFGF